MSKLQIGLFFPCCDWCPQAAAQGRGESEQPPQAVLPSSMPPPLPQPSPVPASFLGLDLMLPHCQKVGAVGKGSRGCQDEPPPPPWGQSSYGDKSHPTLHSQHQGGGDNNQVLFSL